MRKLFVLLFLFSFLLNLDLKMDMLKIDDFNPFMERTYFEILVDSQLYDNLIIYDEQLVLKPYLAKRWDLLFDENAIILELRRGVIFHNGKEMDAEDVLYSLKMPRFGPKLIKKAQILGKYKLKIWLNEDPATYLHHLTHFTFKIVPEGTTVEQLKTNPVGTGPFCLERFDNNRIVLRRFPRYFGKKARIERVIFFLQKKYDRRKILDRFLKRQTDILILTQGETLKRILNFKKMIRIKKVMEFGYRFVMLNADIPPTNDIYLRKAIAYVTDIEESVTKELLVNKLFTLIPWDFPGYDPSLPVKEINVYKAISYLKKSHCFKQKCKVVYLTTKNKLSLSLLRILRRSLPLLEFETKIVEPDQLYSKSKLLERANLIINHISESTAISFGVIQNFSRFSPKYFKRKIAPLYSRWKKSSPKKRIEFKRKLARILMKEALVIPLARSYYYIVLSGKFKDIKVQFYEIAFTKFNRIEPVQ